MKREQAKAIFEAFNLDPDSVEVVEHLVRKKGSISRITRTIIIKVLILLF